MTARIFRFANGLGGDVQPVGNGFSIREVIDTAKRVTGRDFQVVEAERRPGDPPVLVADSSLAKATLGWAPEYADLETIIAHAWAWEKQKGVKW